MIFLFLQKKIGTGILSTAAKGKLLSKDGIKLMISTMSQLNKYAFEAMQGVKADGCTDITGFGLIGHGAEMAKSSNLTLEIFAENVPVFKESLICASQGILPGGALTNWEYLKNDIIDYTVNLPAERIDCLCDPQTSGGLLIACNEKELERLQYQLGEKGCENAVIGKFKKKSSHFIELHNRG